MNLLPPETQALREMNQAQSGNTIKTLRALAASHAPWPLSSVLSVETIVSMHGFPAGAASELPCGRAGLGWGLQAEARSSLAQGVPW